MVEVIGKTIGQLTQMTSLDANFKFLGCSGSNTAYSTWQVTYNTLSANLRDAFMNSLGSDIETRLDAIEDALADGDGTLYFKKNSDIVQNIRSAANFKNQLNFQNTVHFYASSDRSPAGAYSVTFPKDTYMNRSGNTTPTTLNDANRVAVRQDITDALAAFKAAEVQKPPEQILDMSYAGYASNGVKIAPSYTNKNYTFGTTGSTTFYRYAGIRDIISPTMTSAQAQAQGTVYKQVSGSFIGVPLTQEYTKYKTLTFVVVADSSPTSGVASTHRIISINVQVLDINRARQYIQYKSMYKKADGTKLFWDKADKWYFGSDTSTDMMYLSIKCSDKFEDKFLPIKFDTNGYCVIAVFGHY